MHLPLNISAKDRARKHSEGTSHADNALLFCISNSIVVDYPRKFVMDKHLEADSHKQNTEKNEGGKQQALKAFLNCKTTVAQIEKVRFAKPSADISIAKMWKLLQQADTCSSLDAKNWWFLTNTPKDIPQQGLWYVSVQVGQVSSSLINNSGQ